MDFEPTIEEFTNLFMHTSKRLDLVAHNEAIPGTRAQEIDGFDVPVVIPGKWLSQ